jgi:hypothetical protein
VTGLAGAARGWDPACDALLLLGRYRLLVTFELRGAEECFRDALRRAEGAGLPLYRLRVVHQVAWHDLGRSADTMRIEEARGPAEELGALALGGRRPSSKVEGRGQRQRARAGGASRR